MATGHSLEHPAAVADSLHGDFVQPAGAEPPRVFRRYAELDDTPAGPSRVIRAVLLSDTSPPLYYLLLNLWVRGTGTSDAALRLFSVLWATLALPLLWLVGRDMGGPRAGWSACLLFSFSPVASYYSLEGRMYSLLWLLALALTWLTLRLEEERGAPWAALWVLTAAAGLLTHYFFAFVWAASVAWLWMGAPGVRRRATILAAVTMLVVLPWYVLVPASIARWRITGGWLDGALAWPGALSRPLALAGTLVGGMSELGGWHWADVVAMATGAAIVFELVRRGSGGRAFSRPAGLLWLSLAGACVGPLVFDLLRHTMVSTIPRYALPGLPAALLLIAVAITSLPGRLQMAALGVILAAWLPGTWKVVRTRVPRPGQPYAAVAKRLEAWAQPGDVVLVHSIPSGVIGVARYLKRDVPLAPWITQLGTRHVPEDLEHVLHGRRRVAVVSIHSLGPDPVEPWLRAHARLLGLERFRWSTATLVFFAPAAGETFVTNTDVAARWE